MSAIDVSALPIIATWTDGTRVLARESEDYTVTVDSDGTVRVIVLSGLIYRPYPSHGTTFEHGSLSRSHALKVARAVLGRDDVMITSLQHSGKIAVRGRAAMLRRVYVIDVK